MQRKFDVYYIVPAGPATSATTAVLRTWRELLGQNVIELDDLDAVCETIALTVGLGEEAIDLDEGLDDLPTSAPTRAAPSARRWPRSAAAGAPSRTPRRRCSARPPGAPGPGGTTRL